MKKNKSLCVAVFAVALVGCEQPVVVKSQEYYVANLEEAEAVSKRCTPMIKAASESGDMLKFITSDKGKNCGHAQNALFVVTTKKELEDLAKKRIESQKQYEELRKTIK